MIALRVRPITCGLALLVGLTLAAKPLCAQSPSAYPATGYPQTYPTTSAPAPSFPAGTLPPPQTEALPPPANNYVPPPANSSVPPPSNSDLSASSPGYSVPTSSAPSGDLIVREVRIEGNHTTRVEKLPKLSTRVGQPFDPHIVEEDVRLLASSRKFLDVKMQYQQRVDGVVVIFQVVERPTLQYIKFVGNQDLTSRSLLKKSELKEKDPLDPYAVEEARRRLESVYHEKGYNHVQITTVEGSKPGDQGAVFLVDEGQSQRVLWTNFEGNTIASDARLRTQVKTKPGVMWLFGGKVDRKKIDEDIDHLTAYYRGLGFFQAKIGADLEYNADKDWLSLKFVINEGPRYTVRNVSFLGNEKFKNDELNKNLEMAQGKPFNQASLNRDLSSIRDVYGGHGYIFADVQADPRLMEDKPELDLVYDIKEGKRYRVGLINVNIGGENPHTAHSTILDRMSLRPGDVVDTRKIREDERRLKYSGLFANDPTKGSAPKIVFNKPSDSEDESQVADRKGSSTPPPTTTGPSSTPGYRGQSPDDEVVVDVTYAHAKDGSENVVLTPRTAGYAPNDQSAQTVDGVRVRFQSPGSDWSNSSGSAGADPARSAWGIPSSGGMSQGYLPPGAQPLPANMATSPSPPPAYNPVPTVPAANPYAAAPGYSVPAQGVYPPAATPYATSAPPIQMAPAQTNNYQGTPLPNTVAPGYQPAPGTVVQNGPPPASSAPFVLPPSYNSQPSLQPQPQYTPAPAYPAAQPVPPGALPAPPPVVATPGDVTMPPLVDGEPTIPLEVQAQETQTGRLMLGVGINSDAGLVGNFVIDEQNFDITRLPHSWEDIRDGTAWRGAGEGLRLEANPGTEVQRYAATFREPYLYETPAGWLQMNLSAYYFTRIYENWTEGRVGGKIGLGIALTPDFTVRAGFRGERVEIYNPNPANTTVPELVNALGNHDLYGFSVGASHDTRDSPFLPTQGHLLSADFEEVVGSYEYPRVDVQARQYWLLHERADGSGRHVFSLGGEFGVTGADTPIYDNFFPGGFSSLRGFAFRGAAPKDGDVVVGGQFELLGTAEYMFPITADDALRGVVFCDFGTAEKTVAINGDQFRAAPGFGLRINVPAMGPAPIALDFATPVALAHGDQVQNFSFFVGLGRSY